MTLNVRTIHNTRSEQLVEFPSEPFGYKRCWVVIPRGLAWSGKLAEILEP